MAATPRSGKNSSPDTPASEPPDLAEKLAEELPAGGPPDCAGLARLADEIAGLSRALREWMDRCSVQTSSPDFRSFSGAAWAETPSSSGAEDLLSDAAKVAPGSAHLWNASFGELTPGNSFAAAAPQVRTLALPPAPWIAYQLSLFFRDPNITPNKRIAEYVLGSPGGVAALYDPLNRWPAFVPYGLRLTPYDLIPVVFARDLVNAIGANLSRPF